MCATGRRGADMRLRNPLPLGYSVIQIVPRNEAQLDHESRGVIQPFGPERLTAEGRWKHMVHPSGTDG